MRPSVTTTTLPVVCFAPPLTEEKLAEYRKTVNSLALSAVKDACDECLIAIEAWWKLPESTRQDVDRFAVKHEGKDITFTVTPLEEKHIEELFAVVPWPYEVDSMQKLFDELPAGVQELPEQRPISVDEMSGPFLTWNLKITDQAAYDLRNMAFHLLWHARELCLDREPLTQNKL